MAFPDDDENDDYDFFLEACEQSERLRHSVLDQNLNDPYSRARLFGDSTGEADLEHPPFTLGTKQMLSEELVARRYSFVVDHQKEW
jgi:hypothetical protein